jgi:hypothetical protein
VAINLWYRQLGVAYYHLGASSDAGYRGRASFALFWHAIEHFAASGLAWADLGGSVGLGDNGKDGLSRFKRGWSTGSRVAYLCGVVLSADAYRDVVRSKGIGPTSYFPAYREGEFA